MVQGAQADLQAQFSVAYVQAVASVAGFYVQVADRGFDHDGIDLTVLRRGELGLTTRAHPDCTSGGSPGARFVGCGRP